MGAVSYLNTKPLVYGFEHGMMKDEIDLIMNYPSKIATMLINNEIDVGLVPVAIIPELKEHYVIADYCISCDGEVGSVCLFSDVQLSKIEKILLDYESKTSIELLKILIKEYWHIDPVLEFTAEDYRNEINGFTAGLVIGDRALAQRKISAFIFDLGLEWKKFTGLPFVFAAWVSNKKLDSSFITSFNQANLAGLQNIDQVVKENASKLFDLKSYYSNYINYELNDSKKQVMYDFLERLGYDQIA